MCLFGNLAGNSVANWLTVLKQIFGRDGQASGSKRLKIAQRIEQALLDAREFSPDHAKRVELPPDSYGIRRLMIS